MSLSVRLTQNLWYVAASLCGFRHRYRYILKVYRKQIIIMNPNSTYFFSLSQRTMQLISWIRFKWPAVWNGISFANNNNNNTANKRNNYKFAKFREMPSKKERDEKRSNNIPVIGITSEHFDLCLWCSIHIFMWNWLKMWAPN